VLRGGGKGRGESFVVTQEVKGKGGKGLAWVFLPQKGTIPFEGKEENTVNAKRGVTGRKKGGTRRRGEKICFLFQKTFFCSRSKGGEENSANSRLGRKGKNPTIRKTAVELNEGRRKKESRPTLLSLT